MVEVLVLLRAWAAHRRAAAAVQQPELDSARVREAAHCASQRVDLADEMPLREATDRGIAGHARHGITLQRDERNRASHPGRGQRGLAARVARTDDEDIRDVGHLLLSDAEGAEDSIIQFIVRNLAGDLAECGKRCAEVLQHDLLAERERSARAIQGCDSSFERGGVTDIREDGVLHGADPRSASGSSRSASTRGP
jgi:hypothetical protein